MSEQTTYGDYFIWSAASPLSSREMDWHFAHKDFTSFHAGDFRSGNEASEEACRRTIDFINDMEAEDATPEAQAENEASAKRMAEKGLELVAAYDVAKALQEILKLPGIGNLPGFATGLHLNAAKTALERYAAYHPHIVRWKLPEPTP